jgi:hypothetical protein
MWDTIIGFFKGLLGPKGTTQIGKGNQSVSGVTTGDVAGPLAVGTGNVINYNAPPAPAPKQVDLVPTATEVEILRRLARSETGYLNAIPLDGGYAVHIDGHTLGGPSDPKSSVPVHEAVERLLAHGLLTDIQRNGEIFHLSSKGRDAAGQIQDHIDRGERTDFAEIERLMPELLAEMKEDYAQQPLLRELIVLDTEGNVYNGSGVFVYYRSKHPDLDAKLAILENHELIKEITYNNTDRYRVMEKFARYLTKR